MNSEHLRLARYEDFEIGQRATFSKTISEADIANFIAVTGDVNPLHVDEEFSRSTFFGTRIAHGAMAASLISTVVGTRLPGTGAISISQSSEYLLPTRIGDTLTAWVEVEAIDPEAETLTLASGVDNQNGDRVVQGKSVVSLLRS